MPRSGNVLIGPSADGHPAVDHLRLEEPLGLQIVHGVVGIVGRRMAHGAFGLAEEQLLAAHFRSRCLCRIEHAEDVKLRCRREIRGST